ncbi:MAG: hypothetical protein AAF439_14955 [Pseudomonadota bacterium]
MAVFVDPSTNFSQLNATAEADTFIFPVDGNNDAINGFESGADVIDLSLVSGLMFDDLLITQGVNGKIIITYQNGQVDGDGAPLSEKITLKDSANGLLAADLTADDFAFEVVTEAPAAPTNVITDRAAAFNQLVGTDAGDVFTFIVDGKNDGIRGFEDGKDLIDLSAAQPISFDNLIITNRANGAVSIDYTNGQLDSEGNPVVERLWLRDNEPGFSAASLTADDFLFQPFVPPPTPNIIEDPITRFSQLTGTDADDIFVFGLDGNTDAVLGFQDGADLIDLSAVAGLTFADLNIRDGNGGRVNIRYDTGVDDGNGGTIEERVILKDNEAGFFSGRLTEDDFIFA